MCPAAHETSGDGSPLSASAPSDPVRMPGEHILQKALDSPAVGGGADRSTSIRITDWVKMVLAR